MNIAQLVSCEAQTVLLDSSRLLHKIAEWQGLNRCDNPVPAGRGKEVPILGELGGALEVDLHASLTGFGLRGLVLLLAPQDLLLALGLANVLDSDVNSLLNDPAVHELIHADPDRRLGHVEDDSRASVVALVGHALVDARVGEDVHIVAHLDVHQVLAQVDRSMLPELLGKHVARPRSDTERVRHVTAFCLTTLRRGFETVKPCVVQAPLLVSLVSLLLGLCRFS